MRIGAAKSIISLYTVHTRFTAFTIEKDGAQYRFTEEDSKDLKEIMS